MTLVEYADLVAELRVWQRKHREGDPTAYATMKRIEKKVDHVTDVIRRAKPTSLFPEQDDGEDA